MQRGKPVNPLMKLLLSDESAKQEFISLVNRLDCSWDVWDHIKKNGFRGIDYCGGYQTMCHIIRRLGFRTRRGRKATRPHVVANTGSRFFKKPTMPSLDVSYDYDCDDEDD